MAAKDSRVSTQAVREACRNREGLSAEDFAANLTEAVRKDTLASAVAGAYNHLEGEVRRMAVLEDLVKAMEEETIGVANFSFTKAGAQPETQEGSGMDGFPPAGAEPGLIVELGEGTRVKNLYLENEELRAHAEAETADMIFILRGAVESAEMVLRNEYLTENETAHLTAIRELLVYLADQQEKVKKMVSAAPPMAPSALMELAAERAVKERLET